MKSTSREFTQAAVSREEFESRCSALADLLNGFTTAVKEDCSAGVLANPSLKGLKDELGVLLGTQAGRAQEAVDVLRLIVRVRVSQQHRGADVDGEKARNKLGLATFDSDWAGAWEHLRAVALQAFTAIREEISALLPR